MKILLTGGAGFIGSAVVRLIINSTNHSVINIDKLTYAGNLESLQSVVDSERYCFEQVDICDSEKINLIFSKYQPDVVMHLAAESHVDRSIDGPADFIETNIVGTYQLLVMPPLARSPGWRSRSSSSSVRSVSSRAMSLIGRPSA